jgi:lysozyme
MNVNNLTAGASARKIIEHYESCRFEAYQDQVGIWTIGYGHTKGVYPGQVINMDQVLEFLTEDLVNSETCVNKLVTVKLSQLQFDALISFTFNLGCGHLQESTLLKLLNQREYNQVSTQMARWNMAGGVIAKGLVYRRQTEGILFDTGNIFFGND